MFKGDQRDEKELARKQVRGQVLQVKEQVEGPESPEGRRKVGTNTNGHSEGFGIQKERPRGEATPLDIIFGEFVHSWSTCSSQHPACLSGQGESQVRLARLCSQQL